LGVTGKQKGATEEELETKCVQQFFCEFLRLSQIKGRADDRGRKVQHPLPSLLKKSDDNLKK